MKHINKQKKICMVVHSRANYGRIKSVLQALKDHPDVELQLVLGASALLERFGNIRGIIENDGFDIKATIYSIVEGENPTTMAKSTGLAIIELSSVFETLKPDIVLTVADRFETLATAVAASYMNIQLAHTQGGEVTGSIDESVRHAITKLAHIHFPATVLAMNNIIRMGEDPSSVYLSGCPSIDLIPTADLEIPSDLFQRYKGVGPDIDPNEPYIVVLQHPVTTEYGSGLEQINETIKAIHSLKMPTVWLWPNVDAGSDDISKGLRVFREKFDPDYIHFYRNFAPEDYYRLIANSSCLIGNSSSAIREGSYLGVPSVNIGTRQSGRECANNVLHVDYDSDSIALAIKKQLSNGFYPQSSIFGDGNAGQFIAETLATCSANIQKRLTY